MNYRQILFEVLMIIGYWLLEKLAVMLFKPAKKHANWLWSILLLAISLWNLGPYWFCYVLIVWMVLSIVLIFWQLLGNHQFIYRQYWPAFWRITTVMAFVAGIVSVVGFYLPMV